MRLSSMGSNRDEATPVLVRRGLAVRVPGVRAPAAGAARSQRRGGLPAGAVRRLVVAVGAEGPGRDRAEARLDLPAGGVARAPARHPDADAGAAPVQPA